MTKIQIVLLTIILSLTIFSVGHCQSNLTDASGLRQGLWEFYTMDTLYYTEVSIDPDYVKKNDSASIEKNIKLQGHYIDGVKNGVWTSYYRNIPNSEARRKSIITYDKGVPIGEIKVYYNGHTIKYEGTIGPNDKQVTVKHWAAVNSNFYSTTKIEVKDLLNDWTNLDMEK